MLEGSYRQKWSTEKKKHNNNNISFYSIPILVPGILVYVISFYVLLNFWFCFDCCHKKNVRIEQRRFGRELKMWKWRESKRNSQKIRTKQSENKSHYQNENYDLCPLWKLFCCCVYVFILYILFYFKSFFYWYFWHKCQFLTGIYHLFRCIHRIQHANRNDGFFALNREGKIAHCLIDGRYEKFTTKLCAHGIWYTLSTHTTQPSRELSTADIHAHTYRWSG